MRTRIENDAVGRLSVNSFTTNNNIPFIIICLFFLGLSPLPTNHVALLYPKGHMDGWMIAGHGGR